MRGQWKKRARSNKVVGAPNCILVGEKRNITKTGEIVEIVRNTKCNKMIVMEE